MTLREFLLARVAEDEAAAEDWPIDGPWGAHPDGGMWVDPHGHPIYAPRDRVLAEVEAKRRLVRRHRLLPIGIPELTCRGCGKNWPCPDLVDLAAVHADHPDHPESRHA